MQVEMVQRRGARWVLSRYNRQDNVSDMLSCIGLEDRLQSRRTIACFSVLYKFTNNLAKGAKVIVQNSTQLHILLHAHLGMLSSYPLLSMIFMSFKSPHSDKIRFY